MGHSRQLSPNKILTQALLPLRKGCNGGKGDKQGRKNGGETGEEKKKRRCQSPTRKPIDWNADRLCQIDHL